MFFPNLVENIGSKGLYLTQSTPMAWAPNLRQREREGSRGKDTPKNDEVLDLVKKETFPKKLVFYLGMSVF